MGMLRHVLPTFTKPYYMAVGETIGDYAVKLHRAVFRAGGAPAGADEELRKMEAALETFARSNDRPTIAMAVAHWRKRTPPDTVAAVGALFADIEWFQSAVLHLRRYDPMLGNGLSVFQQALKDCGVISVKTLVEEAEEWKKAHSQDL